MAESVTGEKIDLGGYKPLAPFVARRTLDRATWYEGQLMVMYADGSHTGGTCCVFEGNCPENLGPPPHIHLFEHELFFILEGRLKAWCGGKELDCPKDSLLFLPCGIVHWFISVAPVSRIFTFTVNAGRGPTPGNADMKIFKAFGKPAEALVLPPPPDPSKRPDPAAVMKLAAENGLAFPRLEVEGWMRAYGLRMMDGGEGKSG
jgi:mannose-6-phosphate isomerase-like protein (cupin superfamily)